MLYTESLTVHLQAVGYLSNSCQIDRYTSVYPSIRQLSSFNLQHLAALQHRHPSCTREWSAIFVPGDSWSTKVILRALYKAKKKNYK